MDHLLPMGLNRNKIIATVRTTTTVTAIATAIATATATIRYSK